MKIFVRSKSYLFSTMIRLLFILLVVFFANVFAGPFMGVDHSLNLRTLQTNPLLFEFHKQMTEGTHQGFHYPRRDSLWRRDFENREKNSMQYKSSRATLLGSFIGGLDYRGSETLSDTIFPGADGGLHLRGFIDSLEFDLDARIYVESHSAKTPSSFDGQFVEFQREANNSGVEYASYARYRGHLALNLGLLRLDFAHDVMHWGPGYYNNLMLNQAALPYNYASIELEIGPLTVISFYGDLRIYPNSMSMKNKETRKLYGHRYELNFGDLVLGMSELQTIFDNDNFWLFVPVVPLFMEKGNYSENSNNGGLSFDANYRLFNVARIYTEFFLDDMESPISLIKNDNAEAKWAWMAGFQTGHNFLIEKHLFELGLLAEYARVEPWVYTHFVENTAQFANLGRPLGHQGGPNSQTIDCLLYGRLDGKINFGIRQTWAWKGNDFGSDLNDETPSGHYKYPKKFLEGAKMKYSLTPLVSYEGNHVFWMLEWTFFDDSKVWNRIGFQW